MQEVKNSFALYWKIAKSKKITLLLLLLSFFYNIFFFYLFIVGDRDPAEALVRSSFIVQGGILASMMIGVYLSTIERKVGLEELIETISHAKFRKNVGKILFFLSFVFLYLLLNILALMTMFILTDVIFSPFYLQSVLYMLLYWGLSFVIGGLIGSFLAMWIKGRMIYVLSLVIWLFISPLNYPFIIQLGILFQWSNVDEIENFLNIGQNNPHHLYQPFYGFALENYQWLKRSLFSLIFILLIIGSVMIQRKVWKKYLPAFLIVLALTFYTGFSVFGKHQVLNLSSEKDGILIQDAFYYQDIILSDQLSNGYQIKNYEIDLDIRNYLKANVAVEMMNPTNEEMNTFDFLLYHDLKVSEVLDEEGNELEFKQNRDIVEVTTKSPVVPNETTKFTFNYAGISSPFFFANNRAINLLNHFPWLPTNGNFNSSMITVGLEAFRLPNQPNQDISYQVRLKGNNRTFSNLEKTGNNEWEGTSSDGIYLVAGSIGERNINGKSVIYPYTWEKMLTNFPYFEQFIQRKIDQINQELALDREVSIDRYMFIDHSRSSEMPEQKVWFYENSFVMSTQGLLFNDEAGLAINVDLMTFTIVPAMTWKKDGVFSEDMGELRLFDMSYAYFLNIRGTEEDKKRYSNIEYYQSEIEQLENDNSPFASAAVKLKGFIDNEDISEKKKIQFFREWYQSIKNENITFHIERK